MEPLEGVLRGGVSPCVDDAVQRLELVVGLDLAGVG